MIHPTCGTQVRVPQKPGIDNILPSPPANIGILNVLVDAPVLPCRRLCQPLASQNVNVASLKIVDNQLGVGKVFILGILHSNESAGRTLDSLRPLTLDPRSSTSRLARLACCFGAVRLHQHRHSRCLARHSEPLGQCNAHGARLEVINNQVRILKILILGVLSPDLTVTSGMIVGKTKECPQVGDSLAIPKNDASFTPFTFPPSLSLSLFLPPSLPPSLLPSLPLFLFLSSSISVSHTSTYAQIDSGEQRPGRTEVTVDFVTMQLINAALAAASPMVLSSITMQSSGLTIKVFAARL